ncbi:MAG: HEAT repeat domain-containing protein [Candidatus Wallbacteria bacterium]|nr:HEAT repeat domain-containing protein [Candidatus Wallbacteria bacterium]
MTSPTEMLKKLRSHDPLERFDALKAIGDTRLEQPVRGEVLRIALEDKQSYNRLGALRVLKPQWPAAEVTRVFSARLKDEPYIVTSVLQMLGEIGDAQALAMLTATYFATQKPEVKVAVLSNLYHASQQYLYDFLVKSNALNHKDEKVRAATVALLGRQKNPTMRRLFVDRLKDADSRVRANAVEALGEILDGPELARIVAPYAVADPSNRVRANSLVLLLKAGVRKAQDFLIQMAGHTDPRWRASAAYAMRHVPPAQELSPWVRQLAGDADEQVAAQAELALPRFA